MKSLLGHGLVSDRQFGVSPQDGFVIHAEASGSISLDLPVYSRFVLLTDLLPLINHKSREPLIANIRLLVFQNCGFDENLPKARRLVWEI
jgi:hypothetical protein